MCEAVALFDLSCLYRTQNGSVACVQDESQVPPGYNCGLYCCHDALSAVTEKRKTCMPYDGTLDFPVLFLITAMNLIALIYGTTQLARQGEIISLRGTEEQNVKMIALVFALVEVTPGFLYLWCDTSHMTSCAVLTAKLLFHTLRARGPCPMHLPHPIGGLAFLIRVCHSRFSCFGLCSPLRAQPPCLGIQQPRPISICWFR